MNDKKHFLSLSVGLALLICTVAWVPSSSPAVFAQQQGGGQQQGGDNLLSGLLGGDQQSSQQGGNQTGGGGATQGGTTTGGGGSQNNLTSTAGTLDCQMVASTLGGTVISNPTGTCDVAVSRQGVQVQDTATGATLNNLLVMNPLFEFTQISNQGTTGATTQPMVYGFAEFALMEEELPSAIKTIANSSWNVVAVHNHVIGESPSMMFAHAIANGDINTLTRDARMILDSLTTQTQSQSGNQTSSGGGSQQAGSGATQGGTSGSPSPNSLTGGTTTGGGATTGGGVGTFGGGGGTSPNSGIGTTDGGGATTGGGTTNNSGSQQAGGGTGTGGTPTGGAAGPQVRP